MKFTKPQHLIDAWNDHCYFTDGMKMAELIDSPPAEFEIVQPGMTQVRWPEGLTRTNLRLDAIAAGNHGLQYTEASLNALAAIAPAEKKKRKVILMVHESWDSNERPVALYAEEAEKWMRDRSGWRKVGECEVDE